MGWKMWKLLRLYYHATKMTGNIAVLVRNACSCLHWWSLIDQGTMFVWVYGHIEIFSGSDHWLVVWHWLVGCQLGGVECTKRKWDICCSVFMDVYKFIMCASYEVFSTASLIGFSYPLLLSVLLIY